MLKRSGWKLPFALLLVLGAGLSVYYWNAGNREKALAADTDVAVGEAVFTPTRADMDTDVSGAVELSVDETGRAAVITDPGMYRISGRYDSTIVVDAEDQVVRLVLENADISTSDGPAIYVRSAGKVIIIIPEGTESVLSDSAYYSDTAAGGAVYSESDLTINGYGRLTVTGYRKDAVHTEGEFRLLGTLLKLKAKRHGIKANDGMLLMPLELGIEAEGDGLITSKAGQEQKGDVEIAAGQLSIIAGDTAIRSAKDLFVRSCHIDIKSVSEDIDAAGEMMIEEGCVSGSKNTYLEAD